MEGNDESNFGRGPRVAAALSGFVAVALGAFGAHGLRSTLTALSTGDVWQTASLYHLVHSAVLLCIALAAPRARVAFWLILTGVVLFSGSLYVYSLTGFRPLTAVAPVGGACLMAGWLALIGGRAGR